MTGRCFGERLGAGTVVHSKHKLPTVSTYLGYLTYPFGRNVVPITDFLLVSCTTVELCCTARTATLCLLSDPAAVLCPALCCFSSDEKDRSTWLELMKYFI